MRSAVRVGYGAQVQVNPQDFTGIPEQAESDFEAIGPLVTDDEEA